MAEKQGPRYRESGTQGRPSQSTSVSEQVRKHLCVLGARNHVPTFAKMNYLKLRTNLNETSIIHSRKHNLHVEIYATKIGHTVTELRVI